jgi:chromate transporter
LLPGPEAQQLATYIGWLMHRTWGGVVAGALFVLPSLLLLIGLSWIYLTFGQVPVVAGVLYGIKPAVAALVLHAVVRMGGKVLKKPAQTPVLWALAAISFIAIYAFNVLFPWVVGLAALTGWLASRWVPGQFAAKQGHATGSSVPGVYVIDDHTPTPAHATWRASRLAMVLAAGAVLWVLPMAGLALWQGWDSTLAQMGWFFTKAALLTFGGAYAVLPYVVQGAVDQFGWLTTAQMMDGLALGETTPGPLIIVVAFVGFLGGHSQQVLGPHALLAGAALAACVVTWFTFLPSFIFILAGGPLVESTHGKLHFTAPLAAISAAVVGVIASLAVFFIAHVAIPAGAGGIFPSNIDWSALALMVVAAAALIRYGQGVIRVLLASGVAGVVITMVHG